MCNCYELLVDELMRKCGHPESDFVRSDLEFTEGVGFHMNLTEGENEWVLGMIRYRYRPVKMTGPPAHVKVHRGRWKKTYILPIYCPLCGEKREGGKDGSDERKVD